jgi:hypothetical protein
MPVPVSSAGMKRRKKAIKQKVAGEKVRELTPEQLDALSQWARYHGKTWKFKLDSAWMSGVYGHSFQGALGYLQQVRSQFGPSWLADFEFPSTTND